MVYLQNNAKTIIPVEFIDIKNWFHALRDIPEEQLLNTHHTHTCYIHTTIMIKYIKEYMTDHNACSWRNNIQHIHISRSDVTGFPDA